jgi:hypothetical protein
MRPWLDVSPYPVPCSASRTGKVQVDAIDDGLQDILLDSEIAAVGRRLLPYPDSRTTSSAKWPGKSIRRPIGNWCSAI